MSEPKPDGDSPKPETADDVLQAVQDSEPALRDAEPMPEVEPVVTPEPRAAAATPVPPAPPRTPAPPPPPAPRRSGALLGGVIGAALVLGAGYGALRYGPPGLLPQPNLAGLDDALAANSNEISTLKAQIAALPAPVPADPALNDRVAALETALAAVQPPAPPDLSGLETRIASLEAKVAELANQPAAPAPVISGEVPAEAMQAIAALQAEVAALKSGESGASEAVAAKAAEVTAQLQAAQAEAQKMSAAAAAATQAALARAALSRLMAALDSGVPFEGALADLGLDPLPPALATHAATGVPTLQALTDSFPEAARTALEASLKATMGASWTDRAMTFLRTQSGIRSLDPREGSDPDAVLSRAEAAVQDDRLAEALAELALLPPDGQAAMQAWADQAKARIEAVAATAEIAAALGRE